MSDRARVVGTCWWLERVDVVVPAEVDAEVGGVVGAEGGGVGAVVAEIEVLSGG